MLILLSLRCVPLSHCAAAPSPGQLATDSCLSCSRCAASHSRTAQQLHHQASWLPIHAYPALAALRPTLALRSSSITRPAGYRLMLILLSLRCVPLSHCAAAPSPGQLATDSCLSC